MEKEILILIKVTLIDKDNVYCDVFLINDYDGIKEYIMTHTKGEEAYIDFKSFCFSSNFEKVIGAEGGFFFGADNSEKLDCELSNILL